MTSPNTPKYPNDSQPKQQGGKRPNYSKRLNDPAVSGKQIFRQTQDQKYLGAAGGGIR